MKLFEIVNKEVQVSDEAWTLLAFKKLRDRDKTKYKETALKEMAFIYYYCDIRSDYLANPPKEREALIRKDVGLPAKWKIDSAIKAAMDVYSQNDTVIEKLYRQTLKAVTAIGDYLENTQALLAERDARGVPVYDIAKISASVQKVPKLMSDLQSAYKQVVKEKEDMANKKKGSQSFNTFEDGLGIDE